MPATSKSDQWESWRLSPPPEGHEGVGRWVFEKLKFALKYRETLGVTDVWRHNHELYRNRFFKNPKPKITQVPVNLFFKTINKLKAELTDNEPQASIQAHGEPTAEAANAWQAAYEEWWESTKQQSILQESVGMSERDGCQTDEMRFNPELAGGMGEIETVLGDNFGTVLWPGCIDIQKAPMIFKMEAIELDTIYRQIPKVEGKVKADTQFSNNLGEDRRETRGNVSQKTIRPYLQSGYPQGAGGEPFKPVDKHTSETENYGIQKALVVTCWVKDYTLLWVNPVTGDKSAAKPKKEDLLYPEQQPVIDPMSGQPVLDPTTGRPAVQTVIKQAEPYQESKYPGYIRRVRVTNKGDLVLDDLPNPSISPQLPREKAADCYLWDKFPFFKRLSYSDGLSEYGLSIIEQIEPLVIEIAKKITKVGSHLDAACLPPIINPKGSGLERRQINNLPERVWEPTQTAAALIRYLDVPSLPTDYAVYVELLMKFIDIITGLTDITEGRGAQGITAFAAIAALQEKAQSVLREKIRNLDTSLEEQGRMFISLGQNWYSFEKKIKLTGGQGEDAIAFRGVAEQFQGQYAFNVEAGSTLPQSKSAKRQMYLELAQGGHIDTEAILEIFNVPNREAILARKARGPLMQAAQRLQKTGIFNSGMQVELKPEMLDALIKIIAMPEKEFERLFPQAKPAEQTLAAMIKAGIPEEASASADKIFKQGGPQMFAASQGQPQPAKQ